MKRLVLILSYLLLHLGVNAQDAHFSQFYSNPLYLAPSFAGSTLGSRIVLNYRDQWPSIPGTFVTSSFSADHYFSKIKSGMGIFFNLNEVGGGKMTTINIGYQYSYKIQVTHDFFVQPGMSAYFYNRQTNYSKLNFADQFFGNEFLGTTSEILPNQSVNHVDFAVSAMGYSDNYWFGVNVDHLLSLSPVLNKDLEYSDLRFSFFGGVKIITKRTFARYKNNETLHLAFNLRNQSKINQLDIGGYYYKRPVMVGIWYRGIPIGNQYSNSDALIYMLGIKFGDFTFNYSYDMTMGELIATTGGSHEISIIYAFQSKFTTKRRFRAIPCPEF
ncbi:MAG: PorP/SprF family type IX secretion system membrane protein [Bacteroidales bacterium]